MTRTLATFAALGALALSACGDGGAGGQGRNGIWAAGSSTVFPFSTRVAETFSRSQGGATPRVESLGTGGGIQAFCQGIGPATPDIANASRQMTANEFDTCARNGVTDIIELKIGYDGIVVATARTGASFDLRLQDLYLALAKEVPVNGEIVANPATQWSQVNPALPAQRIQVYGPPPTSGTRDAFLELGMTPGAARLPEMAALEGSDEDRFESVAHTLREDGLWIDSGENDNAILQTLTRTPGSLGVFGFSFLEENMDAVKAETIDGVAPSVDTIADGSYPLARSLYIYVKKAHIDVIPGLAEFVNEFMSDASAGRGGYLEDRGLTPLPAEELAQQRQIAQAQTVMTRPE
ncbi:substrate-binding domain-containing protein [Brevundimonas balnearis]|uniref:Substrate-binding domain-containing protein n=1 Tax=Brevundimonas balnearis TaxID=1572858 RepID=A0ABV6R5A4_9CAUL